ncbi:hypothetical protein AGMMS49991_07670 [Spirochaetia bacterium]|nr:hypothetical protein AGMMS49991_07670 [Spirochaetia bacterium]
MTTYSINSDNTLDIKSSNNNNHTIHILSHMARLCDPLHVIYHSQKHISILSSHPLYSTILHALEEESSLYPGSFTKEEVPTPDEYN